MSYPKQRSFREQLESGDIVWVGNHLSGEDADIFEAGLAACRHTYGRANVLVGDPFDSGKGHPGPGIGGARMGVYVSALAFYEHQAKIKNS